MYKWLRRKPRKSVSMKEQAVLRFLKGEDIELVSRESGFVMYELVQWHKSIFWLDVRILNLILKTPTMRN